MLKSGTGKCAKYTLYLINVFFFIVGLSTLGIGIFILIDKTVMMDWAQIDADGLVTENSNSGFFYNCGVLFVATGALLVVMSFIGCIGAFKEVKCVLALYAAMLVLLLILQLAAFALGIILRARLSDSLEAAMYQQLRTRYDNFYNSSDTFTKAYDYAMVYFECCGIRNYTEFKNRTMVTKWSHFHSQTIPAQCCKLDKTKYIDQGLFVLVDSSCPTTLRSSNIASPCFNTISTWFSDRALLLVAVAAVVFCVEILATVLTCCLICNIKEGTSKLYYEPEKPSHYSSQHTRQGLS